MIPTAPHAGGKCKISPFAPDRPAPSHHDYHRPRGLQEAWRLLRDNPGARLVAGGTDVMPALKDGALRAPALISLRRCAELTGVEQDGDHVRIGALTTIAELTRHSLVTERLAVLAQGAQRLGSLQVRNVATVGGNLCNASPCADTAPPLLVLDATVRLQRPSGAREVPLRELFIGPGETVLAPDEILTEVRVPLPEKGTRGAFLNRGRTRLDITKVSVAVQAHITDGVCAWARVAVGSAAPTPIRLDAVEARLQGAPLDDSTLEAVATLTAAQVAPITDIRSTEEYRRALAGTLLRRALLRLTEGRNA